MPRLRNINYFESIIYFNINNLNAKHIILSASRLNYLGYSTVVRSFTRPSLPILKKKHFFQSSTEFEQFKAKNTLRIFFSA
jgi:hypothetical protein